MICFLPNLSKWVDDFLGSPRFSASTSTDCFQRWVKMASESIEQRGVTVTFTWCGSNRKTERPSEKLPTTALLNSEHYSRNNSKPLNSLQYIVVRYFSSLSDKRRSRTPQVKPTLYRIYQAFELGLNATGDVYCSSCCQIEISHSLPRLILTPLG